MAAPPASASTVAASSCHASALDLGLLGGAEASAIAAGGAPCATDRGAVDLNVLGAVQATAVEAETDAAAPASAARITGLDIGVAGFSQQLTAPLLSGPDSLLGQLNTALAGALAPGSQLQTAVAPLTALGLQVTGLDTAELLRRAGADLPAALQATLPSIVRADVITASARAQCVSGRAQLSTHTDLTGLTVLGSAIDPDDPAARLLTLDSAHLTLSQLISTNDVLQSIRVHAAPGSVLGVLIGTGERSLYDLLTAPGGVVGLLNGALPLGTTTQTILNGLSQGTEPLLAQHLDLPTDLLHVKVTPRTERSDGETASATTLALQVSLLGQPILTGSLANASISAGAANCSGGPAMPTPTPPAATPTPAPTVPSLAPLTPQSAFASLPSQLQLQCGGTSIRLIDVRRSGTTTLVRGVARAKYVGRTVDVILAHGRKRVGSATVREDGTFATRVPLPPAAIRDTNEAFYYGQIKRARSNALKFTRRMEVSDLDASGGTVTFRGRTTLPRSEHQKVVVLKRRVTCARYETVGTVRPDAKGRFKATFKAPSGVAFAIYRAETRVPKVAGSRRTFQTYTLPRLTRLK